MPESSGSADTGVRCTQARSSAPNSARDTVDDGGHHRFDLLVRQRAIRRPELEGECQALAALGDRPTSEDVEQRRSVEERSPRGIDDRLERPGRHVVRHHERQIPPHRREPWDLDEPERPGGRGSQGVQRDLGDRDPAVDLERPRGPGMELTQDADRLVPEEDARRPPGVERVAAGARRATSSRRRRPRRRPRASRVHPARRAPDPRRPNPSPAAPQCTKPTCRRSSTGSPRPKTVPTSKIDTDPEPQRWFLATVRSRPGRRRVRSHASSARSGFASGIASSSPISARSSSEANGKGLASRSPARSSASRTRRANA